MAPTVDNRVCFKSFWDKYSGKPDNTAMMLNNNADELEESDRMDILSSLPDVTGLDAVDIGAGIGRFTTILAKTAKSVLSTDFIDEFIKKNKERNCHLPNVSFAVGDAAHLQLKPKSVDFVFTNWLMMYLNDHETVEFITNIMTWLRADGYAHLRESCSEPSTGRRVDKDAVSLHDTTAHNPTSYRYSSLYINLLRSIRFRDEMDGSLWRFDLKWSTSVPTYIKRMNNWRQVHWLVQKVPASPSDKETSFDDLLTLFSTTWNNQQKEWDALLDDEQKSWTDEVLTSAVSRVLNTENPTIFAYTPRKLSPHLHINSHQFAERFSAHVWNAERESLYYRTSLTKATTLKDQRVRFAWHESFTSSVEYWKGQTAEFDFFVATELLKENDEEIAQVKNLLTKDSPVILLEPVQEVDEEAIRKRLESAGLHSVKVTDVTESLVATITDFHNQRPELPAKLDTKWILVEARV